MRLTDVMSGSGLAGYAIVAMVLFMAAFVAILIRACLPSRKSEMDRNARLPFADGSRPNDDRGGEE